MNKGKRILIKVFIIFISVFLIDGGRSLYFVTDNIEIIFSKDHSNDLEVPNLHQTVNFGTEEKFLESFKFDFSNSNLYLIKYPIALDIPSKEFSDSIWQPPKFL